MNGDWGEVDTLLDFLDHIWIGLVLITAAAIPSWLSARNHRTINAIKDQVVNGHEKPMREDLDRAITAIEALSHDLTGLRKDLFMEEDRRRQQINELRSDMERHLRRK